MLRRPSLGIDSEGELQVITDAPSLGAHIETLHYTSWISPWFSLPESRVGGTILKPDRSRSTTRTETDSQSSCLWASLEKDTQTNTDYKSLLSRFNYVNLGLQFAFFASPLPLKAHRPTCLLQPPLKSDLRRKSVEFLRSHLKWITQNKNRIRFTCLMTIASVKRRGGYQRWAEVGDKKRGSETET